MRNASTLSGNPKHPSDTIAFMFHACSFPLNLAAITPVAASARVITIKTTTIKG